MATLVFATGCQAGPIVFECRLDHQCERGVAGRCEVNGYCSYDDDDCPTARRWSDYAGPELAGACVLDVAGESSGASETVASSETANESTGSEELTSSSDETFADASSSDTTGSACDLKDVPVLAAPGRTFCRGATVSPDQCEFFAGGDQYLLVDGDLSDVGESVSIYLGFEIPPDVLGTPWMNVRLVMVPEEGSVATENAGQVWPANAFVEDELPACGGFFPLSPDPGVVEAGEPVVWPLLAGSPVPADDGFVYLCLKPTGNQGVVFLDESNVTEEPRLLIEVCT